MLNKIIFAIDNDTDVHTVAKFLRHIDTARAMETMKGAFIPCIGCYDGELESSYMMDERDYRRIVEPLSFTADQDCIMHVPADTRQWCTLEYATGGTESIGAMRQITALEAMGLRAWTYVLETGMYWTTDV